MHRPTRLRSVVGNLIKCARTIRPGVRPGALVFTGVNGRDEKLDDGAVWPGRDGRLEQALIFPLYRHSLKLLRAVVSKVQLRRHILGFFIDDIDRNRHFVGRRRQGRGVRRLEDHRWEVVGVSRVFSAGRAAVGLAGCPVLAVAGWQFGLAQFQRAPAGVVAALPNPSSVTLLKRAAYPARPVALGSVPDLVHRFAGGIYQADQFAVVTQSPFPRAGDVFQIRMLLCESPGIGGDDEAGVRLQRLVRERKNYPAIQPPSREGDCFFAVVPQLDELLRG